MSAVTATGERLNVSTAAPDRSTVTPWQTRGNHLGYIPAFDGIRAISVAAVLLFHADLPWLVGGFLGVDSFFVLSGFLITSILLGEIARTGRIRLSRFYLGRARRLLPALLCVLGFSAVLALLFAHDAAAQLRSDAVAALGYVTNWWNILNDLSYFEATGRPPLLQHLWSLAVEEQFYLIWPAVLIVAFRWRGRLGVRRVALIGVGLSTLLMTVLSLILDMPTGHDASRLYFGSDTHAMGILLGAALATCLRPQRLPRRLPLAAEGVLTAVGVGALFGMIAAFHLASEDSAWLYRGGFLVFSGLTAALVAIACHPAVRAGRLLGWGPFRYVGTRSYGLYLWHWPVFMVLRPGIDMDWVGLPALVLRLALTVLLAELSFRYVEMPIRRGALMRTWRAWRTESRRGAAKRGVVATGAAVAVAGGLSAGLWAMPSVTAADYVGGATAVGAEDLSVALAGAPAPGAGSLESPAVAVRTELGQDLTRVPVTAIGDSVLLGARDEVTRLMPKLTIDAAISRQADGVASRIKARKAAGQLADVVVIHTGTNGPAYAATLEPMMRELSDRARVVVVNLHMPDKWMAESNGVISAQVAKHSNARLADWAAASAGHREYFYPDGTHTTPVGSRAYATVIAEVLRAG